MMNAVQREYVKAKDVYESANYQIDRLEAAFLASRGRVEKRIYAIDDDSAFEALNVEFAEASKTEWAALVEARENLKQAENDLIAYGISLMPGKYQKEADVLRSCRDVAVRQQMIDLALRLNTRTVPTRHIA
jgi:hypothetical protein